MKALLIINGAAGGGRCAERATPYVAQLKSSGVEVETAYTSGPGDATRIAREARADVVVAVGGDGTLFEVLNGLFPREEGVGPALAVLPLGTGNSFVRDFDLQEPAAAVRALTQDRRRTCDVVRATHSGGELYFMNLLSVGFTARAGALTNRRFKPLGVGGYILAVLASLVKMEHPTFALSVDSGLMEVRACTLLSFSNSRFTGGDMMMAPNADPSDGQVDFVRIGPLGRRKFLRAFPKIFKGTHDELSEIEITRASRIDFDMEHPVDVLVDGEIIQLELHSLEVMPGAVEFVA